MNKKGFTLIELLAVIVVLAVIAIIAVPSILGAIDKAKKGALKDSAYGVIESANLYYAQYNPTSTIRFDYDDKGNITKSDEALKDLGLKGDIKNTTIIINAKGQVTLAMNKEKNSAYKNYDDSEVIISDKKATIPANKYVVYLNDASTRIELSNQELTDELDKLQQKTDELSNKLEALNNIEYHDITEIATNNTSCTLSGSYYKIGKITYITATLNCSSNKLGSRWTNNVITINPEYLNNKVELQSKYVDTWEGHSNGLSTIDYVTGNISILSYEGVGKSVPNAQFILIDKE